MERLMRWKSHVGCGPAEIFGEIGRDDVIRIGWKTGSEDWSCPDGYRLPTVDEYNLIESSLLQEDFDKFSYYHSIAISVGGCNCKWNSSWCGQPSIETMVVPASDLTSGSDGGRMCGDFEQLHICIKE